ncbi:MAG: penicillin acylase family protein [Spirochaetia bacterium]|nr:penicillin acylase family protein [Spirochaetia bacterium]
MTFIKRVLRILKFVVPILLVAYGWYFVRKRIIRQISPPTPAMIEQAKRVRIVRDEWGVPHIFGKSDADAAFGLAYAHSQDDFKFIQGAMVAARGELAMLVFSKEAIINDYYVRLFRIRERADENYEKLSPEFRGVVDGYAAGLNYYASTHPDEADGRFFPAEGKDVARGFIHKIPLFVGADAAMKKIASGSELKVGQPLDNPVASKDSRDDLPTGSNSHALAGSRTEDGSVYLNVNSHQPWEGPVAWYEAQIVSEEGWNMTGGTFPGAPTILHGHNEYLGWAHTVNYPDLVDVYKLEMDAAHPGQYRFENDWKDLVKRNDPIRIDTGFFVVPFPKETLESVHGPVLEGGGNYYAVRVAGIDRMIFAAEQWYRMNKAKNLTDWKKAMHMQGLPMFNTVYADSKNIFYIYNALLPKRNAGFNYRTVLPGDKAAALWDSYLPFEQLPTVENPPSGFIQNCNSTPFKTTKGPGNPDARKFPETAGIEDRMTNRAVRSIEILGNTNKFSFQDFLRMKWDRAYSKDGPMFRFAINPLLNEFKPVNSEEEQALSLLKNWNGMADDSPGASLAILTYRPIWKTTDMERGSLPDKTQALREAISFLKKNFGRIDVPLGQLQRMRHGLLDAPLYGGPDVMNAAHSVEKDGHLVGAAGDSYVLVVRFKPGKTESYSIHQFGNSTHPESKHFNDQAPMFLSRLLKPTVRTPAELNLRTESTYHPGEEVR